MKIDNDLLEEALNFDEIPEDPTPTVSGRFKENTEEKKIVYRDKTDRIDEDNPFYQLFSQNKEKLDAILVDGPVVIPKAESRPAKVTVTSTRTAKQNNRKSMEQKKTTPVEKVSVKVVARTPEEKAAQDQTLICVDCKKEFTLTAQNIAWFKEHNLTIPKRCPECRKKRQAERSAHE
jgi:hypothetical protein